MAEETSGNKSEPENRSHRERTTGAPEGGQTQEPKVIPLKPRVVMESKDVRADREELTRLLESEER